MWPCHGQIITETATYSLGKVYPSLFSLPFDITYHDSCRWQPAYPVFLLLQISPPPWGPRILTNQVSCVKRLLHEKASYCREVMRCSDMWGRKYNVHGSLITWGLIYRQSFEPDTDLCYHCRPSFAGIWTEIGMSVGQDLCLKQNKIQNSQLKKRGETFFGECKKSYTWLRVRPSEIMYGPPP